MGKLIELSDKKTADNHASVISSFNCCVSRHVFHDCPPFCSQASNLIYDYILKYITV